MLTNSSFSASGAVEGAGVKGVGGAGGDAAERPGVEGGAEGVEGGAGVDGAPPGVEVACAGVAGMGLLAGWVSNLNHDSTPNI